MDERGCDDDVTVGSTPPRVTVVVVNEGTFTVVNTGESTTVGESEVSEEEVAAGGMASGSLRRRNEMGGRAPRE